tara:strand:+ start:477 stop:674 length:198 start_codon:yes stop_codon:yes gene_type:complete
MKRYDVGMDFTGGSPDMDEYPDGEWVSYKEINKLKKLWKEFKKEAVFFDTIPDSVDEIDEILGDN